MNKSVRERVQFKSVLAVRVDRIGLECAWDTQPSVGAENANAHAARGVSTTLTPDAGYA